MSTVAKTPDDGAVHVDTAKHTSVAVSSCPIHDLQLATAADVEFMVDVFMQCFDDDYFQALFPPNGVGREYMRKAFAGFVGPREDGQQEVRAYVNRDDEGVVQSTLILVIIRDGEGGPNSWEQRWPVLLDGMDKAGVTEFFEGMEGQHIAFMKEQPHVFVELLMTRPSAQRRGHGSAFLGLAADLADDQGVPAYLDAERDAVGLYERNGFVKKGSVMRTSELMEPMVKEVRKDGAVGV